jgi:hypothetical protein
MDGQKLKQFIKLSESRLLDRYLKSRGISPENLTPIQKISHSKSSPFLNWVKLNGARQDVFKEELEQELIEVLSKDASAGDWIRDFIHSDNPKFAGKSKEKRQKMALAAYYAKQKNEEVHPDEKEDKKLIKKMVKKDALKQELGEKYTAKELKMAGGIAKDKRYAGGNMTGASNVMDKIRPGLSQTKQAQKALRQANEESEQIDELNKDTLYSYAKKSEKDQGDQFDKIGKGIRDKDPKSANAASHKFTRRSIGQNNAEKRLNSESLEIPELQLSELTSNLLARYKTRASADAKAADQAGNYKKGDRRFKGILKATTKQFDNDLKKHNQSDVRKEEIEDWEKEDKSVATYGKKPKFKTIDPKDSFGDNKPQAAAILTGGKTLTGTIRDTIEIDPVMRRKPHNGSEKINKK